MNIKYTYDFVEKKTRERNFQLLSKEYKNSNEKLEIMCSVGHIFKMRFNSILKGNNCPVCCHREKLTYDHIKTVIENVGYTLLSTEYINVQTPIIVQCEKKHQPYSVRYYNFQQGKRCPYCKMKSYEEVKEYIENKNYRLLTTKEEFKNTYTILNMVCSKGHNVRKSFNAFNQNIVGCCACAVDNKRLSINFIKNIIEENGFSLISNTYKNNYTKLDICCNEGHKFKMSYNAFTNRKQCPICSSIKGGSMIEKEIVSYVRSFYKGKILENDRTQIINPLTKMPLELDIFFPHIYKAIEFNGIYWHNEYKPDVIKRDRIKSEICCYKNIDLLVLNEYDWIDNNKQCKNKIKEFLS